MRLFWKLFCSMVMIAALTSSIGGFALIDGQFRAGLNAQGELTMTENALLRRTLLRELQFSGELNRTGAARLADQSFSLAEQRRIFFRLTDRHGQPLAGSRLPLESGLSQSLGAEQQGWELLQNQGRCFVLASSPLLLDGEIIYLENWREVPGRPSADPGQPEGKTLAHSSGRTELAGSPVRPRQTASL